MKTVISLFICFIALTFTNAQDKKVVESEFKVFGNCGMCKSRIEKAVKIKEVKFAKWDKNSKILKIAFIDDIVTADSLQKRIAAVGHDTEKFKAPKEIYENLPECCLYRDGGKTH